MRVSQLIMKISNYNLIRHIIKTMGCTESVNNTIQPIPDPKGPAIDPLEAEGDIVEIIVNDPHINFYQKKIEEVLLPMRMKNKQAKQSTSTANSKPQILAIEKFATTDNKEQKKYVDSVNQALEGNAASVTNIMAYMIEEMADIREGNRAKNKFENDSYAALKCFIYLYTGHYSYKKINSQLRKNDYEKVSAVIGIVQKQLIEYNKEKFARKLKANIKYGKFLNLYRGIPKPDKTMIKGKKQFWKAFTSTSLETSVASRFGNYIFVIELDKNSAHPYMVVPEELSQFKEEQIIIFPYFYFECMGVENFTSGARYECKQIMAPEV